MATAKGGGGALYIVSNRVDGTGSSPYSLQLSLGLPGAPNSHTSALHCSRALTPSSPSIYRERRKRKGKRKKEKRSRGIYMYDQIGLCSSSITSIFQGNKQRAQITSSNSICSLSVPSSTKGANGWRPSERHRRFGLFRRSVSCLRRPSPSRQGDGRADGTEL